MHYLSKINKIWTIILLGFLVYSNSLFNGFVWDDEEQVLTNQLVHSISNLPSFFTGSTFNTGGSNSLAGHYYKPLMPTTFSLIYSVFGNTASAFHFIQLSLHILNAILIYLFFKSLINKNRSFIISLIFLIHPINTESVIYISALQDTLFFTFGIAALNIAKSQPKYTGIKISLLLLLSLLSKETGLLFVFITAVYTAFFNPKNLKNTVLYSSITLGIYLFLRLVIAQIPFSKSGPSPIMNAPLIDRLQTIPEIIFFYIKTFFYPQDLLIAQHWVITTPNISNFYLPLAIVLFLCTALVAWYLIYRKIHIYAKQYLFFLIWFAAGLGLHLQIFPLDMTVADRWFYFPIVGLLGLIAAAIPPISSKYSPISLIILITLISLLSFRTLVRTFDWRDGLTLYAHDSKINQNAFDLENNFGVELFRAGRLDEAKIRFENSTKLAPRWWTNWNNLGVILERENQATVAANFYKKAIDNGQYYLAYQNYARTLLFKLKAPKDAKEFCEQSLKLLPYNADLWLVLAIAEYQLSHKDNALKAAQNAFNLRQDQHTFYILNSLQKNLPLEIN